MTELDGIGSIGAGEITADLGGGTTFGVSVRGAMVTGATVFGTGCDLEIDRDLV